MAQIPDDIAKLPEIAKLSAKLGESAVLEASVSLNDLCITIDRRSIVEAARLLKEDAELNYKLFLDICGADYLKLRSEPRYEVVYHIYSVTKNQTIRLKVPLQSDDPKLPSVVEVWSGAEWYEREAYDMYGIIFENHPFLHRILCHNQFEGHALRKDYPINRRQWCDTVWDLEM